MLVVLAVVVFVGMLVWTVQDLAHVDARVPADGRPHTVTVATDGDRMLLADRATTRRPCEVTDPGGREIQQHDLLGDLTVTRDGREWSGLTRFAPGDGRIVVTCPATRGSPAGEVLIARAVSPGSIILRIVGVVLLPMILGGLGLLWACILGVVILTRRAAPPG